MLILTHTDVENLLTMTQTIDAVEAGFRQLALGNVTMPQRAATFVARHEGLHLSMPAYVGAGDHAEGGDAAGVLAVKNLAVYGDNPARHGLPMVQGVVLLHDAYTGELLALMDAEHLTAMRTGAASGVATRHLARANARTLTLFGAGALGPGQLLAACAERPIERVTVVTRSGAKDDDFCTRMSERLGIPVRPSRDVRAAVENADVICTATTSQTPLFEGEWLRPGTHVNAVGSYHTGMRELDATTLERSRVFVDQRQAALAEAGEIVLPIERGELESDPIDGELGDVVIGKTAGRSHDEEITVFKSVGLALQDAVTAAQVYRAAVLQGVGQPINLG